MESKLVLKTESISTHRKMKEYIIPYSYVKQHFCDLVVTAGSKEEAMKLAQGDPWCYRDEFSDKNITISDQVHIENIEER